MDPNGSRGARRGMKSSHVVLSKLGVGMLRWSDGPVLAYVTSGAAHLTAWNVYNWSLPYGWFDL